MWQIFDWAGNLRFAGATFGTFDDAEEVLSEYLHNHGDYEQDRGEYEICPV